MTNLATIQPGDWVAVQHNTHGLHHGTVQAARFAKWITTQDGLELVFARASRATRHQPKRWMGSPACQVVEHSIVMDDVEPA